MLLMMMMIMMKVVIMSVLAHWLLSTVCDILISAGGIGPYSLQNLTCLESLDWSGARLGVSTSVMALVWTVLIWLF